MSELINTKSRQGYRWQLLTSTSAAALLVTACVSAPARAESGGNPSVWIDLGAQVEKVDGGQQYFTPPFFGVEHTPNPWDGVAPATLQRPGRYSTGGEGSISYYPASSDWVISASIRYGRSNRSQVAHAEAHQYLNNIHAAKNHFPATFLVPVYAESKTRMDESHAIIDFAVGRDVGLGIFGDQSDSVVNVGVRFAQFVSHANVSMYGLPGFTLLFGPPPKYSLLTSHHQYSASANIARSFQGIGPSVSWKASAPLAGSPDSSELALDWGINAAVLFGRQKVRGTHQTTTRQYLATTGSGLQSSQVNHSKPTRSRSVTIPNVGAFAGLSLRFPNARISLGYRADVFFGAVDGGIDTRKTYDRNFYGPFATISIGLP